MTTRKPNPDGVDAVKFGIHDGITDIPFTTEEWEEIRKMGLTDEEIKLLWDEYPPWHK
jgi:hypothetical protein